MNLVLESLQQLSSLGFNGLVGRIEPTMPRHFLLSTAQLQPSLERHRAVIAQIAEAMDEPGGPAAWRNPEIYAQIALVGQAAAQGRDASPALDLLRVHLGMVPFSDARDLTYGAVRLVHSDGSVRVRKGSRVKHIEHEIVDSVGGLPARVLLPYGGLYRDLLGPELYPDRSEPYDRAELLAKVSQAVELLEKYSPEILSDLRTLIQTVVLIPDLHDPRQWSYNLRLGYFGAIFINAFAVNRHGIAEALMHEYLHQRLWQWWTYEPPDGLPPASIRIRSPVTNREKPAIVMLQALLIYVSAHRFYADLADHNDTLGTEEEDWVASRSHTLSVAIPTLHQLLREHVPERTKAASILDYAMETFSQPVR